MSKILSTPLKESLDAVDPDLLQNNTLDEQQEDPTPPREKAAQQRAYRELGVRDWSPTVRRALSKGNHL